jgi:inorganic triphosphatase YgiF
MHIERELKFRLPAEAGNRLWPLLPGVPAPRRRRLDNTYFDTPDFRLRDARAALRLRRDGRRRIMCFKSEPPATPGVPQRGEWEAPAPRGRFSPEALPCDEIRAATGIDLRRLAASLVRVFDTRFERRSAQVLLGDGTQVEVCLDAGTIAAGRSSAPLLELELELIEGSPASMLALAEALVEPLQLEHEARSKAERGYRLLESRPAAPLKSQPSRLRRGMSAEQAMLSILDNCRAHVQGNVIGTLQSRDPEFLHQLRVGLRRLRSALRTFSPLVTKNCVRPLRRELKSVVSRLGSARDWDVLHGIISRQIAPPAGRSPEMARLLRKISARRSAARAQAREALASAAFQKFLLHLMRWTEEAPWRRSPEVRRAAAHPLGQFGRRALARQERKALRHAERIDWNDPAARHRLRILVKRLRYACEFFSDILPSKAARRYLDRLEAVQDVLGELNDISVAGRLLEEIGKEANPEGTAYVQGWFAARRGYLVAQLGAMWRAWKKQAQFG